MISTQIGLDVGLPDWTTCGLIFPGISADFGELRADVKREDSNGTVALVECPGVSDNFDGSWTEDSPEYSDKRGPEIDLELIEVI